MKKIYRIESIVSRYRQRLKQLKTGAAIASLFFIGIITAPAFSQTACDTLIAKDGRRIAVEIIRSKSNGLLYTKCSETTGQQYFMAQEKILELRKSGVTAPVKTAPPPPALPSKEKEVQLKDETDLSKPKTIIWAGFSLFNLSAYDIETAGRGFFQFGAEMGFKHSPLRLGLVIRPMFSGNNSQYTSYDNKGLKGELGLVFKSFTRGRLTGNVSKAYYGVDFRLGRAGYAYSSSSSQQVETVKYNWTSLMARLGFQLYYEAFAFDVALPIGVQFYSLLQFFEHFQ